MSLENIGLIISLGVTSVGAIFIIYDRFAKPDIKAENDISLLQQGCEFKHKNIDEKFDSVKEDYAEVKSDIKLIKENHLRHIEADVNDIKITQKQILTILEAKYQIKV